MTNGTIIDNFVEQATTYTPNPVNQLESMINPNRTYFYDNDGNMTTGFTAGNDAITMTYDAENRMKTAQFDDGTSHLFQYSYAGNSLLSELKKDGGAPPTGSTTKYLRAGFLTIQERNSSDITMREYIWGKNLGGGIGGLLGLRQYDQNGLNGQDYSYLYDGKGNVSALIDSDQEIVASYAYDPFGMMMKKNGALEQPYQFSTKPYFQETGLSDFGYRFYDSCSGKWTTRDPLGEKADLNVYRMAGNNPVNFIDPYGLATCMLNVRTGEIICTSDDGKQSFSGQFASGNNSVPGCKNNPDCDDKEGVGPIPQGGWQWSHKGRGDRRFLEPLPGTDKHNRPGPFQTHSCRYPFGPDNKKNTRHCSEGCVVSTPETIRKLNELIDRERGSTLWVVK